MAMAEKVTALHAMASAAPFAALHQAWVQYLGVLCSRRGGLHAGMARRCLNAPAVRGEP
jgi:hypothetical protein